MTEAGQSGSVAPEILITAAEAFPAFERRVLAAEHEIVMGFRIFDPLTRLHSDAARKLGNTWIDLLADALCRGVRIEIHIADFDPVAATDLHGNCWRSMRILCGLRELVGPKAGARLTVRAEIHPARIGAIARLFFWPVVAARTRQIVRAARGDAPSHRRRILKYIPGVAWLQNRRAEVPPLSFPASHHQKLAVFDERWLYIGGLDLNDRRWDGHDHRRPAQQTWHDVQALLDDPDLAASARRHLKTFNATAAGDRDPADTPGLLRTLSRDQSRHRPWTMTPRPVIRELRDAHLQAAARAERLIYLETQFFRDRGLARALARRGRACPELRMILILPGAPETVAFQHRPALNGRFGDFLQSRCIATLRRAFGPRLLVASPVQPRTPKTQDIDADRASLDGSPLVYLHAKVSIFDDMAGIVSSANLNGRSLHWDTEAGIALTEPAHVKNLRQAVFRHWLPDGAGAEFMAPETAFESWRRMVRQNHRRKPDERAGFLVPYDRKAAEQTALALPGVPEEMV